MEQRKTSISAQVIADSKNTQGDRISTMVVTFPRIVLAEFNTHRMFSRNSASSRAIPFNKMVESVQNNPFIPIAWQKDHSGMQGSQYITDSRCIELRNKQWLLARDGAIEFAESLHSPLRTFDNIDLDGGSIVTKQLCNRLLEPFMYHTVIVTSGREGLENFFKLRCPQYGSDEHGYYKSKKDALEIMQSKGVDISNLLKSTDLEWLLVNKGQAEIHMMALAECMWDALNESTPKELKTGEWHIPFGDDILTGNFSPTHPASKDELSLAVKVATARCARISYTVVGEEGKTPNYENDIKLHDMLATSGHWSPFEHCARAMDEEEYLTYVNGKLLFEDIIRDDMNGDEFDTTIFYEGSDKNNHAVGWCRNFKGFVSYRYILEKSQ